MEPDAHDGPGAVVPVAQVDQGDSHALERAMDAIVVAADDIGTMLAAASNTRRHTPLEFDTASPDEDAA